MNKSWAIILSVYLLSQAISCAGIMLAIRRVHYNPRKIFLIFAPVLNTFLSAAMMAAVVAGSWIGLKKIWMCRKNVEHED